MARSQGIPPPSPVGVPASSGRAFASLPSRFGLTGPPQAATASPAAEQRSPSARTILAAFVSRSWRAPHWGQVHSRSSRASVSTTNPHAEQVLEEGYQRSILISLRPYQLALYSNWRRISPQPTSAMALESVGCCSICFTASDSTQIV